MLRQAFYAVAILAAMAMLPSCSTFDCPLNNKVYASIKLAGNVKSLDDTLSVSIPRNMRDDESDTVVVNRLTETDSLSLPISYVHDEDLYLFHFKQKGTGIETTDSVWVKKTNEPHFESVDCSPAMFHTVNGVRYTRHSIDSISINNNKVTYNDAKAHFFLYLKGNNN